MTTRQMGRNTVAIWIAAPLQYLLITVNVVALEKVCFSDNEMLSLFVNMFPVNDKHYLVNRDNLTQPIQIQLFEKQKKFFPIFSGIFKIYIKFQRFAKKRWPSYLMYFRKYWLRKIWLDICLKSRVSEYR